MNKLVTREEFAVFVRKHRFDEAWHDAELNVAYGAALDAIDALRAENEALHNRIQANAEPQAAAFESIPSMALKARIQPKHLRAFRTFAVDRGWFEVPATNGYEALRLRDGASGVLVVYLSSKRTDLKIVAPAQQPAAQALLTDWLDRKSER